MGQTKRSWFPRIHRRVETTLSLEKNISFPDAIVKVQTNPKPGAAIVQAAREHLNPVKRIPTSFKVLDTAPWPDPVLERTSKIPDELDCRLVLKIDGKERVHYELFKFRWQQDDQARECENIIQKYITNKLRGNEDYYKVSQRYSIMEQVPPAKIQQGSSASDSLRLVRTKSNASSKASAATSAASLGYERKERYTEDIEASAAWHEYMPIHVARHFLQNLSAVYFLEITIEYSSFIPHPCKCKRDGCSKDIIDILHKVGVKTTDSKVKFVSGKFLSKYFDRDLIKHLIEQDTELSNDKQWRDKKKETNGKELNNFVEFVWNDGVRIFATCINARLSILRVYQLWKDKMDDTNIPISEEQLNGWGGDAEAFYQNQFKFKAHEFPSPTSKKRNKFVPIDKDVIMPFLKKEYIGGGGYGEVFSVRIHELHHAFAPHRDQEFALKVFPQANGGQTDFEKERKIYEQLAEVPHEHLTPFLTSWQQGGQSYILFPLARCDLHKFLTTPSPESKTGKIDWLLRQMLGLARALGHIHNLAPQREKRNQSNVNEFRKRICCHYDLKPGNVLVFGEEDILKISDFGQAVIKEKKSRDINGPRSPKTNAQLGDEEYSAPEIDRSRSTSRSCDIWSLGCIYLVMLLWFFGYEDDIEAFREERIAETRDTQFQTTAFWRYNNPHQRQPVLQNAVIKRLKWLNDEPPEKKVFQELVQLVQLDMLCLDENKRLSAPEVSSELAGLLLRARLHQKEGRNFFDDERTGQGEPLFDERSSAGSPTEVGEEYDVRPSKSPGSLHPDDARRSHSRQSSQSRRERVLTVLKNSGSQFGEVGFRQQPYDERMTTSVGAEACVINVEKCLG